MSNEPKVIDLSEFKRNLVAACPNRYNEKQVKNLYCVAAYLAVTCGIPAMPAFAERGAAIGLLAGFGLGSIPGYIVGGLVGLVSGTSTCFMYY